MHRQKLIKPTLLSLAVSTTETPPPLTHFTVANLCDPLSTQMFQRTYFELGTLGDSCDYDLILGPPFFNVLQFCVAINQCAIICEKSDMKIFDVRHLHEMNHAIARSESVTCVEPPPVKSVDEVGDLILGQLYKALLLKEFQDLFPEDIPQCQTKQRRKVCLWMGLFQPRCDLRAQRPVRKSSSRIQNP